MRLRQGVDHGCKFWYREDDRYIGQRVALGKYEPYLTKLMLGNVNEGDTVVDVGANIGYDTVLFGKKARKVYAFEPEKINFGILKKNIKENKLKNIKAFKLALGSKKEEKRLFESRENYGDNRLNPSRSPLDRGDLVDVAKLDDVVSEKVDLIKIDTQGWEPEVIAGAKNLIKKYHPKIFFEWSPKMYVDAGLNYQKMWNFLMEEYNRIYYVDEYIQVYYPVEQCNWECNLWVGESNWWKQYRDFWPKKWLKRILGKPAT